MQRLYHFNTLNIKVNTGLGTWGLYCLCLNILMKPSAHWWRLRGQLRVWHIPFFLWLTAMGETEKSKKKDKWLWLVRMWVDASETRDVEFRCMVTDGKPCRNQKIVLIFLWFCSGYIRCKWNPYYRMDGLRNKDKHRRLKFAFPSATFFVKMSIADCFTCLCSAHSFSTEKQTTNNHLSNVKKVWKNNNYCLHLTNVTKATWKANKVKKKNNNNPLLTHIHVSTRSSIVSAYHSSLSCLILIAICLRSQVPVPHSCFQRERN